MAIELRPISSNPHQIFRYQCKIVLTKHKLFDDKGDHQNNSIMLKNTSEVNWTLSYTCSNNQTSTKKQRNRKSWNQCHLLWTQSTKQWHITWISASKTIVPINRNRHFIRLIQQFQLISLPFAITLNSSN